MNGGFFHEHDFGKKAYYPGSFGSGFGHCRLPQLDLWWKRGWIEYHRSAGGGENYGDAQYVDANTGENEDDLEVNANGSSFFSEARLTRQQSRDSAIDTLTQMFQDSSLSDEQKSQLAIKAAGVAEAIETEGKIENMIKAKGFSDCMVYIDGDRVDVIVKTNGLLKEEVAQIKDILVAETGALEENISITEAQ